MAGATPDERDAWLLEDASDYALLASSGTFRLPGGPFSDDSINMDELRASMKVLGFKPKHMGSIFSLLVAILLLGNLEFADWGTKEITYESARVTNQPILERISHLLGVEAEALEGALTNKTNWIRKELSQAVLPAPGAVAQRDRLVQDLYAILFAYVVEFCNRHTAPPAGSDPPFTQIVLFDQPGFQSRNTTGSIGGSAGPSPLVSALGNNRFEEFTINYQNEVLHQYLTRQTFDDTAPRNARIIADGIALPAINIMDNSAAVELLRGSVLAHEEAPGGVLGMMSKHANLFRAGRSPENPRRGALEGIER